MWNRHNVHKMFINIYRNPKTRNWFRYENFIHLFEFKGFSTWGERETQFFCADCFYIISSQPNQRAAPVALKVVWPRPALNLDSLVRRQEFNSPLFLKSQKSSAHVSGVWRHSHPLVSFFYLRFYFDICEWRILPARAWTPALMFAPNWPMHWAERFSS